MRTARLLQQRLSICLVLSLAVSVTKLWAEEPANTAVPPSYSEQDLVGEARLKVLFWDVYDARLYAPDGELLNGAPFALSLTYLRDFEGEDIAVRSIDEIRGQGFKDEDKLTVWLEELRVIFPNVLEGDEIVGVVDADQSSRFFHNGILLGTLEDTELTQRFFDIWLSEDTSEPKMRAQLLGLNQQ